MGVKLYAVLLCKVTQGQLNEEALEAPAAQQYGSAISCTLWELSQPSNMHTAVALVDVSLCMCGTASILAKPVPVHPSRGQHISMESTVICRARNALVVLLCAGITDTYGEA